MNESTKLMGDTRPSRSRLKWGATIVVTCLAIAIALHPTFGIRSTARAAPLPVQVLVSLPLIRNLDTRTAFLGQLSAVDQVELRAQVGGTLDEILFKDGSVVRKGDLLFRVDPRPYKIKLAQANALLESTTSRAVLADREFERGQALRREDAGSVQNVDQRSSEQGIAHAAVSDAKAQIDDAQFDLEHCRITAPFTGRIGTHLVSIGTLIAGSRAASSPTTVLATLVSLDPIYLDFDMSEAEFLAFSRQRGVDSKGANPKVSITIGDETAYTRGGVLDFLDNVVDRSSGTLHARVTVPNKDLSLTAGEFARARVSVIAPAPTLLIPDTSVLADQSERVVLTVTNDGTVAPKQVKIGDLRGGLRVIKSGLTAGDRVIIDGIPFATPGSKVSTRPGTILFTETADGG